MATETFRIPEHFQSSCAGGDFCARPDCPEAVKQEAATGRWFVTLSHAGFNSRANNGRGFATEAAALASMRRFLRK